MTELKLFLTAVSGVARGRGQRLGTITAEGGALQPPRSEESEERFLLFCEVAFGELDYLLWLSIIYVTLSFSSSLSLYSTIKIMPRNFYIYAYYEHFSSESGLT